MTFVKLTRRIGLNDMKLGASMSMRMHKGSTKPITFVGLRRNFLDAAKFGKVHRFDIAIGEGPDAGKIRIAPDEDGVFLARSMKAGTLVFDLGHVPQFGNDAHQSNSAEVALIDGAAVVTVPDWNDDDADDDDEETGNDHQDEIRELAETIQRADKPVASPQRPQAPQRTASPALKSVAKSVTFHGITINLTPDSEAISFRGETVEVSQRGAQCVECLARVMPSCVGDDFLIGKLWKAKPNNPTVMLDLIVRDLSSLKTIGLEIRTQRGIGRQLVESKCA